MNDVDFINSIKSEDRNAYLRVSSREKLIAYTIKHLQDNQVKTSFNNICVAAFKLFPDKFFLSEDFREYPHIEMLNRTLLHLQPKERNYATGSSKKDYVLTPLGKEIARLVGMDLSDKTNENIVSEVIMDEHKDSQKRDYLRLKQSEILRKMLDNEWDNNLIWQYFEVTPYTQTNKIKRSLVSIRRYAKSVNDETILKLVELILNEIGF